MKCEEIVLKQLENHFSKAKAVFLVKLRTICTFFSKIKYG